MLDKYRPIFMSKAVIENDNCFERMDNVYVQEKFSNFFKRISGFKLKSVENPLMQL